MALIFCHQQRIKGLFCFCCFFNARNASRWQLGQPPCGFCKYVIEELITWTAHNGIFH